MALKVLIVDDSITVRAVLSKALQLAEADVEEILQAGNGREALDTLSRHTDIDVVFTDIVMPVMDGEQFVAALHEAGDIDALPVVVISSAGDVERITRLRELGARGFIHKPFTPEQIQELLNQLTGVGSK